MFELAKIGKNWDNLGGMAKIPWLSHGLIPGARPAAHPSSLAFRAAVARCRAAGRRAATAAARGGGGSGAMALVEAEAGMGAG